MSAANTRECFSEFIGRSVVGVLSDALPPHDHRLAAGNKTLVFDDGRGLTISRNGAHWIENKASIDSAIEAKRRELQRVQGELADALKLAGGER